MPTWDAEQYLRFNDQRTRPCRELATRVAVASPDSIIDLGCGPGNSTTVLAGCWPKAELTGLDSSPGGSQKEGGQVPLSG
jgi:trans-aconitate 2-methyltransferase